MTKNKTDTRDQAQAALAHEKAAPNRDADEKSKAAPHTDNERLDEGLEETFPASDPVAVKHIT